MRVILKNKSFNKRNNRRLLTYPKWKKYKERGVIHGNIWKAEVKQSRDKTLNEGERTWNQVIYEKNT